MLTLTFNEREERMMKALVKQGEKLGGTKPPTVNEFRAHQILSSAVASMIEKKMKEIPWN